MSGLNPKQQRFVSEYLIDLNATQAAIRAGYTPTNADVTGPRLLGNVRIANAVKAAQAERAAASELSEQWVLDHLKENVERAMVAIPVMQFDHEKKEMVETGEYQYEGTVANKALELIGIHRGMFIKRKEITGAGGGPIEVRVRITKEGRRVTAS
jgi:phage terminase small subunit